MNHWQLMRNILVPNYLGFDNYLMGEKLQNFSTNTKSIIETICHQSFNLVTNEKKEKTWKPAKVWLSSVVRKLWSIFHFISRVSLPSLHHFPNYLKQQSGLSLIRELITLEQNFWSCNYHPGDSFCLPIVSVEANNYSNESDD